MDFIEGIFYMMWRGIAIGIIMSAPMGPVGILCIQRTLEKGRLTGFFTGVGAALSDLLYCLLTGFGLSFIEDFLKANQNVIQIVGSVVLIAFGVYLFRSNPARQLKTPDQQRVSKRKNILSGFLFTFSNPLIIFLVIGLFARFNFMMPEFGVVEYLAGFVCIIIGALLWWWMVTFFVDKVRAHFNLRSMWLINKITGGIVMIFALVGIITAITNHATAATRTQYLNSARGFGDYAPAGEPLAINNPGPDTLQVLFPLNCTGDFRLRFRAANEHNLPNRGVKTTTSDGTERRVDHPSWGVGTIADFGSTVFWLHTQYDHFDDLRPATVIVSTSHSGVKDDFNDDFSESPQAYYDSGLDPFNGWNAFELEQRGTRLSLKGGNRKYIPLAETDAPAPVSVGIFIAPGSAVVLDYIEIREQSHHPRLCITSEANPDVLASYLQRSKDSIEGIWEVFDYTLEETLLKKGGQYRLAIIADGKGNYEMAYLDGAMKLPAEWKRGMLKGRLIATHFPGVYDVVWYAPDREKIPGDNKAQIEQEGVLSLQFPAHTSTLRLRRISDKYIR